jgi:hypothetical protein
MLYLINQDSNKLEALSPSTFKELKIWERKDIEQWIKNYPAILQEELLIITTEYDEFDKSNDRLDILAVDKKGKLVIIELKRDIAPSTVELQAIKYAAFCSNHSLKDVVEIFVSFEQLKGREISIEQAESQIKDFIENNEFNDFDEQPRIILVAQAFRQDTTSSVLWLRSFGVNIECVKLEAYLIEDGRGKKTIGIKPSIIIPLPDAKDFIVSRERKETETNKMTKSQEIRWTMFERLITRFKKECPGITERASTRDSFLGLPIGFACMHFEWTIRKRPHPHFIISLDLEKPDCDDNKVILKGLEKYKVEFQELVGDIVTYDYNWGTRWCRLSVARDIGEDDKILDDWIIETTKKFYEYLKPKIDKIVSKK